MRKRGKGNLGTFIIVFGVTLLLSLVWYYSPREEVVLSPFGISPEYPKDGSAMRSDIDRSGVVNIVDQTVLKGCLFKDIEGECLWADVVKSDVINIQDQSKVKEFLFFRGTSCIEVHVGDGQLRRSSVYAFWANRDGLERDRYRVYDECWNDKYLIEWECSEDGKFGIHSLIDCQAEYGTDCKEKAHCVDPFLIEENIGEYVYDESAFVERCEIDISSSPVCQKHVATYLGFTTAYLDEHETSFTNKEFIQFVRDHFLYVQKPSEDEPELLEERTMGDRNYFFTTRPSFGEIAAWYDEDNVVKLINVAGPDDFDSLLNAYLEKYPSDLDIVSFCDDRICENPGDVTFNENFNGPVSVVFDNIDYEVTLKCFEPEPGVGPVPSDCVDFGFIDVEVDGIIRTGLRQGGEATIIAGLPMYIKEVSEVYDSDGVTLLTYNIVLDVGESEILCPQDCVAEICTNSVDDDSDGLIDCADPECTLTDPSCDDFSCRDPPVSGSCKSECGVGEIHFPEGDRDRECLLGGGICCVSDVNTCSAVEGNCKVSCEPIIEEENSVGMSECGFNDNVCCVDSNVCGNRGGECVEQALCSLPNTFISEGEEYCMGISTTPPLFCCRFG